MLSNKKNILQLVALLHEHGIEDVVVCPGSRNAAIVYTLTECGLFRCHALTDERSAGFFALGMSLATRCPVAVCVTSGSALANLYPAAAEAFYQHVPLVLISADRPAAWIGQMDGQTMPQQGALGEMVRLSVNLPEGNTREEEWHVNRLVNEALMECVHHEGGPVHINVPIGEPFYDFRTQELPEVRVIRRMEGLTRNRKLMTGLLRQSEKRMILVGQKTAGEIIDTNALEKCFVCLCEHLSNMGGEVLKNPDGLIQSIPEGEEEKYAPELLITVGGHFISKPLKQFLRKYPPRQHWHVSASGEVADTYQCLTTVVEARPDEFIQCLSQLTEKEERKPYTGQWRQLAGEADTAPRNEQERIVASFIERLNAQPQAVLHLANSTAVRIVQRFALNPAVTVCCNRGINGIEGSLSAAVGYASAYPGCPNYVLIGDLSFFYDQNALWNTQLPQNLHILLLNSGGGQIFDTLPVPETPESRKSICALQHFTAETICSRYRIEYHTANNSEEWQKLLPHFINSERNILIEIPIESCRKE